jgi:fatty acid desaturase
VSRPAADPLFRSARREALIALATWGAAVIYSVTYCYQFGYGRNLESLTFVLWFPDWVFWGIVVPWLACIAFSVWFAFGMMRDEDLGSNDDEDGNGSLPLALGEGHAEGNPAGGDARAAGDAHG